jgi:hypothetical protein
VGWAVSNHRKWWFDHGKMVMFPQKSGFDQEDGRFFVMKQVVI